MHEADFSTTPISDIVKSFGENGSILLRNFAEPARLQQLKAVLDGIYAEVKDVHVFGDHLTDRGLPEIHEYIFAKQHRELLDQVFAGWRCELYNTLARRMEPPGLEPADEPWQQPLSPHLDAFLHGLPFTVNFWVPLQPCGADAPRLGVVRAPFGDILDFVGYHDEGRLYLPDPELNFARFNGLSRQLYHGGEAALETFRARYADRIWTPHYRLGDAMMLSNWTFYFTHTQPGMTQRRENIELRFRANDGNKFASLADFLEHQMGSSAASAFTFAEEEPAAPGASADGAAAAPPPQTLPPQPPPPVVSVPAAAPSAAMEAERELSTGTLAAGASFRLLITGRVGVKEIERLIRRLELDRDILADEEDRR